MFAATQLHRIDSNHFSLDLLERYWKTEKNNEPAETFVLSDIVEEALQKLEKTCRHNGERYEIGLLWKTDVHPPNNYYPALNRVRTLEKRLTRNPESWSEDKIRRNSAESAAWKNFTFWLNVENPKQPGNVRRVASAASKYNKGSLNPNFPVGPDLLANLLELILRFRENTVGVLPDIEGMLGKSQSAPKVNHRRSTRFPWMSDNIILKI